MKAINFKADDPYYKVEITLANSRTLTLHPLKRDIPTLLEDGLGLSSPDRAVVVSVRLNGNNILFTPMACDYKKLERNAAGFDKVRRIWRPELKIHQTYYFLNIDN